MPILFPFWSPLASLVSRFLFFIFTLASQLNHPFPPSHVRQYNTMLLLRYSRKPIPSYLGVKVTAIIYFRPGYYMPR
ncbi:hypothetical protein GGR53DRAFT_479719 [Hypoxylon sp. FL1150]|nr:hypothetical protein GGR53DRAFT_479719 [Hypoxylon sp. FL1150]